MSVETKLPEGWVETKLDTLATDISYGYTASSTDSPVGPQMLRITDIQDGKVNWESVPYCEIEDDKKSKYLLQKNDLVFARTGATVGKSFLIKDHPPESVYASYLIRVRVASSELISLLAHFFNSDSYWRQITEFSAGIGQPNVNGTKLKGLSVPLPPLAEQQVIADQLDTLLAQVEATKTRLERIPDILKRFRQSVLAAAVSGKLTEGWRAIHEIPLSIEKYNTSLGGFKLKAKRLQPISENGSWLACQLGHVISVKSGDGLTAKKMSPDGNIPVYGGNGINGYHDQSNVNDSKVVIGRVGFYCGSVHLTEKRAWITDNALIVEFPEKILSKDFVFWLLNATNLREDSASSAQPVISGTKIYSIPLQIPPIEEQQEIVRRVEQLFAYADTIERQVEAAQQRVNQLTQSILAKAFRGELTADWRAANPELISGDNSAEALLARIKAEKQRRR